MAIRIMGARVKSAARAHAVKQLSAITGEKIAPHAAHATFAGKTAFAIWKRYPTGSLKTFSINYPALPDNALLSRGEADLIAGYTLHELGHVAFTNNDTSLMGGHHPLLFAIWNGIEDGRIEHAVIQSGRAKGARSLFKKLMSRYTLDIAMDSFNPCSINSAPFALAMICRAALGDGNGYAKTLLSRIPAPWHGIYAKVANAMPGLMLSTDGTAQALELAKQFLSDWIAAFPDTLSKQQPRTPPESREDDEDEESISQPSQEESEDEDLDDGDIEDEGSDEDWDEDEDEDEDEDGDDAGSFSIPDEVDAEQDDDDQLLDSNSDDEDDAGDASEDSDGDFEGGGSSGSGEEEFTPPEEDKFEEDKLIKPEPSIDSVIRNAAERTKSPITLPATAPAPRSTMATWKSIIEQKDQAVSAKRSMKKLDKGSLAALKSQLTRMLKAPETHGWDGGALGGRFDGRKSARMLAGSERVFKRRWMSEGIDTAVSIVLDMSSSMSGHNMREAVQLAWTVAEACQSARAQVEVVGFADNNFATQSGGQDMAGKGIEQFSSNSDEYRALGYARNEAKLIVAKSWRDRCENVAHHFTMLAKSAYGSTPDFGGVKSVCETLSTMPQQRKLVIVITDGYGDTVAMGKLTRSCRALYGVDIVGFGIGCYGPDFAEVYAVGAPVSVNNLQGKVLAAINSQLEHTDNRRVA